MKQFLLLLTFTFGCLLADAQNFSGQWKGAFIDKSVSAYNWADEESDYVLDIDVDGTNVTGYSYTYFTADGKKYYTICRIKGKFFAGRKYIEITETERTKTNIPQNITNSFQLHKLSWSKIGNDEILEGKWEPAPGQDKAKTGFGTTKLKKRQLTEISALAKKKNSSASISQRLNPKTSTKTEKESTKVTVYNKAKNKLEISTLDKNKTEKMAAVKAPITKPFPITKPSKTDNLVAKTEPKTKPIAEIKTTKIETKNKLEGFEIRKNNIIQTINTENETIKIELYDNGDIDGDSVSVFFNNAVVLSHKKLTNQPLTLDLPIKTDAINELVMYADNLGTIPPNTALLIITDGKKRYEVRITSDLEKSGAIKFVHSKKE
jgi:hypothetical protein